MISEHEQIMSETRASNDPKPGVPADALALAVDVRFEIPCQRIADLVITAFEGGITYWMASAHLITPSRSELSEKPWYASPELYDGRDFVIRCTPLKEGGDDDYTPQDLTIESLKMGFMVMSRKFPSHFADFMGENEDATTADVWFQCCMFADVIFG